MLAFQQVLLLLLQQGCRLLQYGRQWVIPTRSQPRPTAAEGAIGHGGYVEAFHQRGDFSSGDTPAIDG